MPYRRTYRRKRYTRPTRRFRRRFRRTSRYNKRGQKLYLFKRFTGNLGSLTLSSVSDTFAAYNFSLDDLPNYTEFTNLYDMYKINAVKVSFIPQMTENISTGSVNNPQASTRFFSVIDYNDSASPTSIDELRQYQSCKMTPILKTHKRYIMKPKILDSSNTSRSPWMATSSPTTNYYGLKVAVENTSASTTLTMDYTIEAKYYLSFKNVR